MGHGALFQFHGRKGWVNIGTNSLGVIWVICPCQKQAGLSENTENGYDIRHRKH